MANSSIYDFLDTFDQILRYNNNMGSVTLYMATGGTNFGYTAGAPPRACCCSASGDWDTLVCKLRGICPPTARAGGESLSQVTHAVVNNKAGSLSLL